MVKAGLSFSMSSPDLPPPIPGAPGPVEQPGLSVFLSLVLVLFVLSGAASAAMDAALLFFHRQDFAVIAGLLSLLMFFAGALTYSRMAFNPAIPKRIFFPVALFLPVANVAILPVLIFYYDSVIPTSLGIALLQMLLGLALIGYARGGSTKGWPLVAASRLNPPGFRFGNFVGVTFVGLFIIVPVILLGVVWSAQMALSHYTDGFVTLRPAGLTMQMRKYVRSDGREITLVPMIHVGDPAFYRELSDAISPESVVLMEGVTDDQQLVPQHIDYSRMAKAIGGVQQVTEFRPPGKIVPADVDLSSLSPSTLQLLKNVMLFHANGATPETIKALTQPAPPGFEQQLFDDLLTKRNRHLLDVLRQRLLVSDKIVIPWGAAHMPGISREVLQSGFHQIETRDFVAVHFLQ